MASMATMGKPSYREGSSSASAAPSSERTSLRQPSIRTPSRETENVHQGEKFDLERAIAHNDEGGHRGVINRRDRRQLVLLRVKPPRADHKHWALGKAQRPHDRWGRAQVRHGCGAKNRLFSLPRGACVVPHHSSR